MKYQLSYATKNGKSYYYGEYNDMVTVIHYQTNLMRYGEGKHRPEDIKEVVVTIHATK